MREAGGWGESDGRVKASLDPLFSMLKVVSIIVKYFESFLVTS